MGSREDLLTLPFQSGMIQLDVFHQLIHIPQDEHIAIQQNDSFKLSEGEQREFTPGVVEARIAIGEISLHRWNKVLDVFLGDVAPV